MSPYSRMRPGRALLAIAVDVGCTFAVALLLALVFA